MTSRDVLVIEVLTQPMRAWRPHQISRVVLFDVADPKENCKPGEREMSFWMTRWAD